MEQRYEVMAPAGSYEALEAAIDAGADSVYFGITQLNMRARAANNFTINDLHQIVKRCKEVNVRTYLTLNTILYDHDITLMKKIIDAAKEAGITAIIAADIAAIHYASSQGVEVHISTQANISNIEAVKFYAQYADVVVLARELTLQQIEKICNEIQEENVIGPNGELVQVEIFAHGALCVAISGKCYMSLATHNASANRGACSQNCRKAYRVIDDETGQELKIDNEYVMSPKDLCTIGFLDKLLAAGIHVLKLEGRGRAPEYVHTVVKCYKEAAQAVLDGTYTQEKILEWTKELSKVYNRGFWQGGYYLGKKIDEWSKSYGSQSTKEKERIGTALHYYPKVEAAEFMLDSGDITVGDEIIITGPTTGVIRQKVESLQINNSPVQGAQRGQTVAIKVGKRVREKDKLHIEKDRTEYQGTKGKIKVGQ